MVEIPGRIVVPLVSAVGERPDRRLDELTAPHVIERPPNRFGDERAPRTSLDALIEIGDEIIVEGNV